MELALFLLPNASPILRSSARRYLKSPSGKLRINANAASQRAGLKKGCEVFLAGTRLVPSVLLPGVQDRFLECGAPAANRWPWNVEIEKFENVKDSSTPSLSRRNTRAMAMARPTRTRRAGFKNLNRTIGGVSA
jgi:hypothetical protein